jgi:hypothetical protein
MVVESPPGTGSNGMAMESPPGTGSDGMVIKSPPGTGPADGVAVASPPSTGNSLGARGGWSSDFDQPQLTTDATMSAGNNRKKLSSKCFYHIFTPLSSGYHS